MGALPKILHDSLKAIERGEMAGPRVVYCNAMTNVFQSHPDIDPDDISIFIGLLMAMTGNSSLWFKNIAELEEKMKVNVAGGASFIKLTMDKKSLLCGRDEIPVYTDEHLRVIMAFAQNHNLPTAAHIHTKYGFDRALQYGINSMEHTIADAEMTDHEVSQMAKRILRLFPP